MRKAIYVLGGLGAVALVVVLAALLVAGNTTHTAPIIDSVATPTTGADAAQTAAGDITASAATRAAAAATLTVVSGVPTSTWPPVRVTGQPTDNTTPFLRAPTAAPGVTPTTVITTPGTP